MAEDSGRGPGLLCSRVLPQGTAASTKNKLPSLITSMETVGAKALEDFADNIKVMSLLPLRRPACGAVGRATMTWLGLSFRGQASLVSCQHPRPPFLSRAPQW